MNLDEALQTFIAESRELLEAMETALLGIDAAPVRGEAVHEIFRAAHTIKGSAGLFGLDAIVAFTHVVESVLDELRDGRLAIDAALVALLLGCADHIGALVDGAAAGQTDADPTLQAAGAPLLAQLRRYLNLPVVAANVATAPPAATAAAAQEADTWHLSLRFAAGVLRHGMDPLSFIRYLRNVGDIVHVVTVADALPEGEAYDPECCYLGFEIALRTAADKATIEAVFEFVLDDCTLHIVPPQSRVAGSLELLHTLPEAPERLGDILVRCGTLTRNELERALAAQRSAAGTPRLGEILVQQTGVAPAVVDAALERQQRQRDSRGAERASIRVDADKLDWLIDLVGELTIASAGATLCARRSRDGELLEAHSMLSTLVEQVRDSALQLRMVKIGGTFARFQRVVHDVARELGKDIRLAVSGEDTELDKTVIEKITDPLTHLVRNAMDHGIESAELRAARGKPAQGTVRLAARHESGSIVIEVGDDGGGLDRERILAKAVERGLVEPGRTLGYGEIYGLIFEPGFSTAEQVTNLSGRGVGMDVVKRNITALRGSVGIDSRPGLGTTVSVRLPLTLAIIDGFQVGVGRSVFVVPLEVVEECIEYAAVPGQDYTNLRGRLLPFIRLRELFEIEAAVPPRQSIVVVRHAGQRVGLVVDTLLGEAQTVIKPLSRMFAQVRGIAGSSIRGRGDVALILDVPGLVQRIDREAAAA